MDYLSHIIYILATSSLLIGSILTFRNELPDYFYLIGTSLFLLKALLGFLKNIRNRKRNTYELLEGDLLSINN